MNTKQKSLLLLIIILLSYASVRTSADLVLYVSTDGSDSFSGILPHTNPDKTDGPLATLHAARDKIRLLRSKQQNTGPITVSIRAGLYTMTDTLNLEKIDSGNQNAPITYSAHNNESVRIITGKQIADFKPLTDKDALNRIDKSLHLKILQLDLKANGITDLGKLTTRGFGRPVTPAALELFFNKKPMTLARFPNTGWMNIDKAPNGKEGGMFTYTDDRPQKWNNVPDIWIHGYWTHDWADSYEQIDRIDTQKKQIFTKPPHGVYGYTPGKRFYALNILEELDSPGEYYIDRKNALLYFYPPEPIENADIFVSILDNAVTMKDVSFVTIQGLTIEGTRANALVITGGTNNKITGCTLRNIGNRAVTISGGSNNAVISCDIYNTGDGGISLSGGDRKTLTPANNLAENNHIRHYSRFCRTYRPAVGISGVGNKISHNLIHDGPHNAIQLSGNDHIIEFNEIYNVCWETGDVGAFYMGRDWTARGTVIRHNFFHDIHGPYSYGANAVYLDDSASGITIFGNVFYKAGRAAFIGGGRDNIVDNNIFIECDPSVHIDARGLGWMKYHVDPGGTLPERLKAVDYKNPPWSDRYPQLVNILNDDPGAPKGNVIKNNVSVGGKWLNMAGVDEKFVTFQNNLIDTDPGFVDTSSMNFQLKAGSVVYEKIPDFKKIPFENIGLYKDQFRKRTYESAEP